MARICGYRPRQAIGALGSYPVPAQVDYDYWSGPAPVNPMTRPQFHYDWHWQRLYGNGDLGEKNTVSAGELKRTVQKVHSFDDNEETLARMCHARRTICIAIGGLRAKL